MPFLEHLEELRRTLIVVFIAVGLGAIVCWAVSQWVLDWLIANTSGLIGGGLLSWLELGISPAMFATRLVNETDVSHAIVGLSKAPVFAILIGIIGCQAGLAVGNTTESLGQKTSSAVVAAIFAVILADALFSIFYQQVGL